ADFHRREAEYIKQWKTENPGQAFDAEAEDHAQFYDAANPECEPQGGEKVRSKVFEERIEDKARRVVEREVAPIRRAEARKQIDAAVTNDLDDVVVRGIKAMSADLEEVTPESV